METPGLEYPCSYPIKVFLKPGEEAEARIEALVRAELAEGESLQVKRSNSSSGAYVCLTLTFTATDAEHAKRVGSAVRDAPGVLLSL